MSSSADLHPQSGGRFVLTRQAQDEGAPYRVEVYLPRGRLLEATLLWTDSGQAVLDPALPDAWAHAETLKLARVLRRTPKAVLSRWRGA